VFGQFEAVRAEAIRLDHVGASRDVIAVYVRHQGRLRRVKGVKALADGNAPAVEQGAHRAVEE
jgi:hypothetical protein